MTIFRNTPTVKYQQHSLCKTVSPSFVDNGFRRIWFALAVQLFYFAAQGQTLEPRAYANIPKNVHVAAVTYAYAKGNVVADPVLPISNFKIVTHNIGFGYVHTFGLAKKLARVQVIVPVIFMQGNLTINGRDTAGTRNGSGDSQIRFGINLLGSPALDKREFRNFKQKTILGVSLVTSVPTGLYHADKRINIGSHRWAFKPEVGISKWFNPVYAEAYVGVWFYTKNKNFLSEKILEQKPVFSSQVHVSYYFKNQMWLGLNGNWFTGGESVIDNVPSGNLKDNWRVGLTWSVPFARFHSVRLQLNTGAFTKSGLDYNTVSLGYQYIFL